jgi:hypothetical protein
LIHDANDSFAFNLFNSKVMLIRFIQVAVLLFLATPGYSKEPNPEFYSLIIYRLKNKVQEENVDQFLKTVYLQALHKSGKNVIGVFKPIQSDTISFRKFIYVLTPFASLDEFNKVTLALATDKKLQLAGSQYFDAKFNEAPYERMETILMRAFTDMPKMETPSLKTEKKERVYELRSYESATEKLFQSKVKMFNDGDEIGLFKRLGFNAVFYAEVLSGKQMPNLMYMTSFDNKIARDEHWKSFVEDPQWKKLLTIEEYKNTVSKIDIMLLFPTEYSDY